MAECEAKVKEETKATIRVIPFEEFQSDTAPERCAVCGSGAKHEVVWCKSYLIISDTIALKERTRGGRSHRGFLIERGESGLGVRGLAFLLDRLSQIAFYYAF